MAKVLNEIEAKLLVGQAGVSVVPTELARSADEAVAITERLGLPVALKIVSPDIAHKSDVGGVSLGLTSLEAVRAAYAEILTSVRSRHPQARIDGVAVQTMAAAGGVEVIIGVSVDPQFGHVLMCGLGGVLVEALQDVSFRVLPITATDARAMLDELQGARILRGVRGRPPVDRAALEALLLHISELIERRPDILELDLNPVLAYADRAVAVDARACCADDSATEPQSPNATGTEGPPWRPAAASLERPFNARVVAVVGDKMMNGFLWLRALRWFAGKLYSVQIDPNEIAAIEALGVTNVRSLAEIPEPVDYVIVAVPRNVAPRVLADCARQQVGAVTMFTAGFSETGDVEGQRLERELLDMARRQQVLLIGPNCMGLANPRLGLCNFPGEPAGEAAAGSFGFIGQSGTHTITFCMRAPAEGLGVSKAASFGNGIVVDAADFLDYLRDDDETTVIGMYLEGVRDGRRLLTALQRTTPKKPVVVWKGGLGEAGQRAIFSHTASLATPDAVWRGVLRQARAIVVDSQDALFDAARTLQGGRRAVGVRAGIVAMTGGPSVAMTDAFTAAGLDVPTLSDASYATLAEFFQTVGGSFRNPLDAGSTIAMGMRADNLQRLLDVLHDDAGIDLVAVDLGLALSLDRMLEHPQLANAIADTLQAFAARSHKLLAVVADAPHRPSESATLRDDLRRRGILTFVSPHRAATALRRCVEYWASAE